jgi:hypothetical protein
MSDINIAALISYRIYPAKMGGQKGIALFYEYLSKLTPVKLITIRDNANHETPPGIQIVPLLSNSKLRYINFFYFFRVKNYIRKNNISHLIIEHPYFGWLAIMLKWFSSVKIIIHSHNIEACRFRSTGRWWWGILWHYERMTHRKAHLNFFIQDNDKQYAIDKFKLDPAKCATITYGIEINAAPSTEERQKASTQLRELHRIDPNSKILLFNGTLDYQPNKDALDIILEKINPLLMQHTAFQYKIIICGNRLPASYNNLAAYLEKNIIYAGFVDDINLYFKGADIFLNPVTDGGGIKTKVVEALALDLSVVSTENGAIGIPSNITADKMEIIGNDDWDGFVESITKIDTTSTVPPNFFEHFYWGNIVNKALESIKQI